MMNATIFLIVFLLMGSLSAIAQHERYVIINAVIYTVSEELPTAEAMAVENGRIAAVGTAAELTARFPQWVAIDAAGRTIIPGLIDAHAHLMGQGTAMLQVDLVRTQSVEEVIERLRAFEGNLPDGAWLVGRGWDQNNWPVREFPTRYDLDEAFPERPVWLRRIDGHAAWANTAAMRAVGRDIAAMPDPEGGRILRDAEGEPTGVFIDAAMGIVGSAQPEISEAEQDQALQLALREANRHGLTGVHDAGIDLATVRRYQRFIDGNAFPLRLYGMISGAGETLEHFCGEGALVNYGERLTVRSVKLYIDGALGSRGAALLEDYSDDPGNRGLLMTSPDEFERIVERVMNCGFQANTHAIGDRGNRVVLDAYERVTPRVDGNPGRHRIEHAQIVSLEDIPRFAELGVIASMQPIHGTSDMYWAEERVGPERIRGGYAWRAFLDSGAVVAAGSDFPVEPMSPLLGFFAAITRQDTDFWPEGGWYPEERMTREEALRAFTLDAAYAAFQEDLYGSLEPGKRADFVVLSRNIMEIDPAEILETEVVTTFLDGAAVYGEL